MNGGLCSRLVSPDPALIDLGLEALWDFGRLVFTASLSFPQT
jgi:hypothetical protein